MASRNVKDAEGRVWACRQDETSLMRGDAALPEGRDVSILCTTASVSIPVRLSVGSQWTSMDDKGLARLISEAASVPKR